MGAAHTMVGVAEALRITVTDGAVPSVATADRVRVSAKAGATAVDAAH